MLYTFTGGTDGCSPSSNLIFDAAGNLYGTASGYEIDQSCNNGTVFELSPGGANDTWTFKLLYSFGTNGHYGADPGSLIFDSAGNLYGTTQGGGPSGGGTVFELSPGADGTWTEKVLQYFSWNGQDGFIPVGGVILDKTGNLYGVTCCGGGQTSACPYNSGCGVVFELSPGGNGEWTETVLHRFKYVDGNGASAGLTADADGDLYGTTQAGGVSGGDCPGSCGLVFELSKGANGNWTEKVLHYFTGSDGDGNTPAVTLIFDSAGNLYGTTEFGGAFGSTCNVGKYNCGTVFELSPGANGSWMEKVLLRFNGADSAFNGIEGAFPEAGVILDTAGNLYGDTTGGGTYGLGTVFQITP